LLINAFNATAFRTRLIALILCLVPVAIAGCASEDELPEAKLLTSEAEQTSPTYKIGPGDSLQVFVWQNQDLSGGVSVRPDGRITMPLIEDMTAAGKTPSELARDMETELSKYVRNPLVTIMVGGFAGTFDQQIRVVGAAQQPASIPYRANTTVLDVMISVGGLTEFASGNRAKLVRVENGQEKTYRLRLDDLIRDGDITANAAVLPGDVIIIPQTVF
jgi:polysaccharide export outer membrane protein